MCLKLQLNIDFPLKPIAIPQYECLFKFGIKILRLLISILVITNHNIYKVLKLCVSHKVWLLIFGFPL